MSYIINLLRLYDQKGWLLAFYLISWILILVLEKKKENKTAFVFSAWYLPFVILNPFVGMILEHLGVMPERMVRIYWLLPVVWVIAYGFTLLVSFAEKKIVHSGVWMALALSMVMVLVGVPIVTEDNYVLAQNKYKIPQVVIDVVDFLNDDYQGEYQKMAVMPEELSTYARVYDGTWYLAYGRTPETEEGGELYRLMGLTQVDVQSVVDRACDYGCSYLVLDTQKDLVHMPEDGSLIYLGSIDRYNAYRIVDVTYNGE